VTRLVLSSHPAGGRTYEPSGRAMSYETGSETTAGKASLNDNGRIPFSEAASELQTEPHLLWRWSQRFALFLGPDVAGDHPHYSPVDLETLRTIQSLTADGDQSDQQIAQRLALKQAQQEALSTPSSSVESQQYKPERNSSGAGHTDRLSVASLDTDSLDADSVDGNEFVLAELSADDATSQALRDVFSVLANSQQAMLNNQASMREIVGVVVQDNFNLKNENRKLRERMLELERSLAEYQRREETRKERLESRLRALEGTISGLQQQIAQIVQLLRKRRRRFFW